LSVGTVERIAAFLMHLADLAIILAYVVGLFVIGGLYGGKVRTASDLFAAGGRSPWWVSGLSGFMTMFSAGTFVVWGGIAFKHGLVAVSINMCYGVAALLVGWTVAGRWKESGIATPAEFVRVRFGPRAVHAYTWTMMVYRLIGTGVSLYALAVLLCALIPVPEGWFLRDAATGNLSLSWAIVIFGTIVLIYTVTGGLWAVLMTDVLQFIVLYVAIGFVVPLVLRDAGGVSGFLDKVPPGFLALVNHEFTGIFLLGWAAIHFFMVGAEWAFVQRYLCVPTPHDARKSAWLFGALYLVSPLFWMLPPLVYRVVHPEANPEQAYILAAWSVLPAGMLGLMVAAMFSATASMVSSQLNVFAGVLTQDIIVPLLRRVPGERTLVRIGRGMTLLLGVLITAVALVVPALGGAERIILSITSLIVGPLLLPLVWALFSRKITTSDLAVTAGVCGGLGLLIRFGTGENGPLTGWSAMEGLVAFARAQPRSMEAIVGVLLPALILALAEWRQRRPAAGAVAFRALAKRSTAPVAAADAVSLAQPVRVVGWSLAACAMALLLVTPAAPRDRGLLLLCALLMAAVAAPALLIRRRA
jgi:solute:Na+ symporter, SSS family